MSASIKSLVDKVLDLAGSDAAFLELGRALRELQERDPLTFAAIRETPGLGRRRAYYLVSISRALDGLAVPDQRLIEIGWTKLQFIAPLVDAGNVAELLTLAETKTAYELEAILKDGAPIAQARCMLLRFTPGDYQLFVQMLLAYGATKSGKGLAGKEKAVARLLQDVLGA